MNKLIEEIERYTKPEAPHPSKETIQNWVNQLKKNDMARGKQFTVDQEGPYSLQTILSENEDMGDEISEELNKLKIGESTFLHTSEVKRTS